MRSAFGLIVAALVVVGPWVAPKIVSSSSLRDRNDAGTAYFADMAESDAYKYYSANPFFADGKTAQLPPPNTIPREVQPYWYEKTVEGQTRAGLELSNPVANTPEQIARGRALYREYCVSCHGETGRGDGPFVTSRKVRRPVTSLVDEYVQTKPDGEIFHVLTVGSVSGLMGSFNWQVKPEDRWRIVRYLKTELKRK